MMTASQVCFACKGRKKKCDKQMPRCSYCEQKDIECCYDYHGEPDPHSSSPSIKGAWDPALQSPAPKRLHGYGWETDDIFKRSPAKLNLVVPVGLILDPVAVNVTVSLEAIRIIQASHQSIDDIGIRYFNGIHQWVSFLCPDRFGKDLVQFQSFPTAEFSLLLLCMCLIAYDPPQHSAPPIRHDALYLHTKTLFTQVQVLRRPSIHLIQAGILISTYEYANRRPNSALASINSCTYMAYKVGLHQKPERPGWSDAWNTWWAIRIFERIFYCETTLTNLPLMSSEPDEADLLPHEVGDPECEDRLKSSYQVAPVNLVGVGCLGRAAQAAYLLGRVIQTVKPAPATNGISRLVVLDSELQRLLFATMNRCHGKRRGHCGAVGISLRALIILHQHILQQDEISIDAQCRKHSKAALDTVAQMVVDIARSHREIYGADVDIISPICNYVVHHVLQHIYEKRYADSNSWFQDTDSLRQSLDKLNRRWATESSLPSDY